MTKNTKLTIAAGAVFSLLTPVLSAVPAFAATAPTTATQTTSGTTASGTTTSSGTTADPTETSTITASLSPTASTASGGCDFGTCASGGAGDQVDGQATLAVTSAVSRAGNPPVILNLADSLAPQTGETAQIHVSTGTLTPLGDEIGQTTTSTTSGDTEKISMDTVATTPNTAGTLSVEASQNTQEAWLWTLPAGQSGTVVVSLTGAGLSATSKTITIPASTALPSGETLDVKPEINHVLTPGLSLFAQGTTTLSQAQTDAQQDGVSATTTITPEGGANVANSGTTALTLNGVEAQWSDPQPGQSVMQTATIATNQSIVNTPFDGFSWDGTINPVLSPAMIVTTTVAPTQSPPTIIPGKIIHEPNTIIPGKIIHEPNTIIPGKTIHEPNTIIPGKIIHEPNTIIPGKVIREPNTIKKAGPIDECPPAPLIRRVGFPWGWLVAADAVFLGLAAWWAKRRHRRANEEEENPESTPPTED